MHSLHFHHLISRVFIDLRGIIAKHPQVSHSHVKLTIPGRGVVRSSPGYKWRGGDMTHNWVGYDDMGERGSSIELPRGLAAPQARKF